MMQQNEILRIIRGSIVQSNLSAKWDEKVTPNGAVMDLFRNSTVEPHLKRLGFDIIQYTKAYGPITILPKRIMVDPPIVLRFSAIHNETVRPYGYIR